MKNKILNFLVLIFSILVLIYPISYGITDLKPIIIFCAVIAILFLVKIKYINQKINIKINKKYYLPIILLLALITRLGTVFLFNSYISQVSDFRTALRTSQSLNFMFDYHRVYNHWILWPFLLNLIYKVLGNAQIVALITNAIILTIVSVLVYKVTNLIFDNPKYGFIAALIYIFWPANILYTLIFTQEHLGILLILLAIYIFLILEKNNKKNKIISLLSLLLIGLILALSSFFKNFAPVLIIAFAIYYFLNNFKKDGLNIKKEILSKFISIVIIIISFISTQNIIFTGIDQIIKDKVDRNTIPCYLNVGLRGNGHYSDEIYGMYFDAIKKYDYDYNKANKEIMSELITTIKDGTSDIYKKDFFENKAKTLFNTDSARLSITAYSFDINEHYKVSNIIRKYIIDLNNYYYIILSFLVALGLIDTNKKKNLKQILLYIIIHGSALLLILVEAQNRYMYSIQMLLCILAVPGLKEIYEYVKKHIKNKELNS